MDKDFDNTELQKIELNKLLFSRYKQDHFEIDTTLEILDVETLPVEIPMNNNQIFIRDLTKFIVDKKLEPYIQKQ
jgi:hypothetical protein